MVFSLALRMLGDRHRAEDLAQEAFLQLHRKLTDVQSDEHLLFWLRQVTTRMAIDRLRRRPRFELVSLQTDPGLAAETAGEDPLLQRQLRGLIAELPAPARAVLLLRYQEDLEPLEIAAVLAMPVNTVKSHLKRSLASLRERIAGPAEEVAALRAKGGEP
jgi:RNA polymerase sigma-70 factor, ECF subfamily